MVLNSKDFEEIKRILNTQQKQSGFLTPDQAAEFLNISKSMIYKLGSLNVFPRYKPTQGLVYYKKSDLVQWIENGLLDKSETIDDNLEIITKMLDKNSRHEN